MNILARGRGGKFLKKDAPQNNNYEENEDETQKPKQESKLSKKPLPEIATVDVPQKNHTASYWEKYDHLLKIEIGQGFELTDAERSQWSYTIREVSKDNPERKYRFVRSRTGLFLTRKS